MMNDKIDNGSRWQIFELGGPGHHFPRWVVARSLRRALAIALDDTDDLEPGLALVVWNKTAELRSATHRMRLQTVALLNEQSEGLVYFDCSGGWTRLV